MRYPGLDPALLKRGSAKDTTNFLTVPKISMGWLPLAERQSEAGLPNPVSLCPQRGAFLHGMDRIY